MSRPQDHRANANHAYGPGHVHGHANAQDPTPIRMKCIVLGSAGAGKTSILRRYFNGTFEYGRRSTLGADFYTQRTNNPLFEKENNDANTDTANGSNGNANSISGSKLTSASSKGSDEHEKWEPNLTRASTISLQMWDTAGRERFVAETKSGVSSTLGDTFFQHADAAILVYDATSSRSFTQLLRWYSEIQERMKSKNKNIGGGGTSGGGRFPVIVVANKLDIIHQEAKPIRRKIVPQRNVLKLHKGFKGKDHRYEYTVSSSPPTSEQSLENTRVAAATAAAAVKEHQKLQQRKNKNRDPSGQQPYLSYGLTESTWTTDFSYLNSVIMSEDVSFPDRDMVILWCLRNGLQHVEVSALDGTGVSEAVSTMMQLALSSMNDRLRKEREEREQAGEGGDAAVLQAYWKRRGYEHDLDLTARYTPKESKCGGCCWFVPWCR